MKLIEQTSSREARRPEKQPFAAEGDGADESAVIGGSGLKVLVVDDNAIVLKACELKLKANGFKVVTAPDASTCLCAAREEVPDAIVLDLNFPTSEVFSALNWDGLRILRWLRQCAEAPRVPVIILTGDESEKNRQLALAEGAAAHFQKPVDWKVFISTLANLIGSKPHA